MKRFILICVWCFSALATKAGVELDSLKTILSNSDGVERVDILLRMSFLEHERNTEKSLEYAQTAIKKAAEIGDKLRGAKAYVSAGIVLRNTGDSETALDYFFRAANLANEEGDAIVKADAYHKISVAYLLAKDFENALKYGKEEEAIWREIANDAGLSKSLNSLGLILLNMDKKDEAEAYLSESLKIAQNLENNSLIYKPMLNLGDLFLSLQKPDKALEYINQSTLISEQENDLYGQAVNMLKKGEALMMLRKYSEAIEAAENAKERASKIQSLALTRNAYQTLADIYEADGQFEKALAYNKQYIATEDSMMGEVTKREIAKMESKYEIEEQQREIERMTKEASYRTTQTISFILAAVLLSILGVVLVNRKQLKKRAEDAILDRNDEIIKQNSLLNEQKQDLKRKNQELDKTIGYAKLIQDTVLFSPPSFLNIFTDYFMMNQPKNSVGGDFCWFAYKSDSVVMAIGDCTGHGVEGGFNTMIANTLLTQIVNERDFGTPADILNELHKKLNKLATPQENFPRGFSPNMKLAICQINVNSKRMMYAGAKIPLYTIQEGNLKHIEASTDDVLEQAEMNFQNQIIQLKKGDKFLLFTDGYAKQIGGEDSEAFGENNLSNTLSELAKDGLPIMKDNIAEKFKSWKGEQEQTDDLLIFGLQV